MGTMNTSEMISALMRKDNVRINITPGVQMPCTVKALKGAA